MKANTKKTTSPKPNASERSVTPQSDCPLPEAFLEEAKAEPKRMLISDHIETIYTLRDRKRFTFREIAEWFRERGFEVDHSAIYRAYLNAIPVEKRDPKEDWSDVTPE